MLTMYISETGTRSEPRSTCHQLGLVLFVCEQCPLSILVSGFPSTALSDTATPIKTLLNVED